MNDQPTNSLDLISILQTYQEASNHYDIEAMEPALVEAAWQRIKTHLEAEKRRINNEINQYPPPIPACDVQFNYLLEQRAGIAQEIQRMVAAYAIGLESAELEERLIAFVQTSSFIDDEARQSFIAGGC